MVASKHEYSYAATKHGLYTRQANIVSNNIRKVTLKNCVASKEKTSQSRNYLLKSVILHLFAKAIKEFNYSELADSNAK